MNKKSTMKDYIDIPDQNIYETAKHFQYYIHQFDDDQSYPYGVISKTGVSNTMNVIDYYTKKEDVKVSFVSSNYLGLATHPLIKKASINATLKYGTGTCTAPPIGGYYDIHKELEEKLARLHSKEDAILFTSGYAANIGVFQNLFNKTDIVFADMLIHASIYDGLKNQTNIKLYKHNDMDYLEFVLKREQGKYRNMAIIVDGVFSQDGDIAKLPEITFLSKKYNCMVFVDDAHGVGVLGDDGKGTLSHYKLEEEIDIVTGTLSKGLGSAGGYAAGSKELINYLRLYARSNAFSASIAPSNVAAASKSIDILLTESQYLNKLRSNTNYIKKKLSDLGFDIGMSETPIIPLMIRDDIKAIFVARKLFEKGIFIIPATYPAVKLKNSRLRLNISALHEKENLDYFCDILKEVDNEFSLNISNNNY